jgi:predicted RNase H-like HicB family nuclease
LPDFENLAVEATSIKEVEEAAQIALLWRILLLIGEGKPLPKPDQVTELVKIQDIWMIAPLPLAA